MAAEASKEDSGEPGLSGTQLRLFSLLFFCVPIANVLLSSVLYYAWRRNTPRRAKQINNLGFVILGLQILLWSLLIFL